MPFKRIIRAKKGKKTPVKAKEMKINPQKLNAFQVNNMIEKYMLKRAEVKQASFNWLNINPANAFELTTSGSAVSSLMIMRLTPDTTANAGVAITQGVGQGGRIGNRVRIKKAILDMTLHCGPYDETINAAPEPVYIVCYILRSKGRVQTNVDMTDSLGVSAVTSALINSVFNVGVADAGFSGKQDDITRPINTDLFTLKKRFVIKIGNQGYQQAGGENYNFFWNNDFSMNVHKRLDVTKYLPKEITFNDTTDTYTGNPVFLIMEKIRSSNVAYGSTTLYRNEVIYDGSYTIDYQDY